MDPCREPNKYLIQVYGYSKLHLLEQEEEAIELLEKQAIDPRIKTKLFGLTPLHTIRNSRLVPILVYFGADVNQVTNKGVLPVSMDPTNDKKNKQLIKYGSLINIEHVLFKTWLNMLTR